MKKVLMLIEVAEILNKQIVFKLISHLIIWKNKASL